MITLLDGVPAGGRRTFIFRGRDILVDADGVEARADGPCSLVFEDSVSGAVYAMATDGFEAPEGTSFEALRRYFAERPEQDGAVAARLMGLSGWLRSTRYCCTCGSALTLHASETALVCPSCGKVHYPRISPCVIAVIKRDDRILLLRHRQRNQDIFACLAGFVETGESLEQALIRETREETGLEICNIRYAGSQGWPFPDQLMVGFFADYNGGELRLQEDEIIEAGWFSQDEIPPSPRPGSISYALIHSAWKEA